MFSDSVCNNYGWIYSCWSCWFIIQNISGHTINSKLFFVYKVLFSNPWHLWLIWKTPKLATSGFFEIGILIGVSIRRLRRSVNLIINFFLKLHHPKSDQDFWRISALASKMGQIKKKMKALYYVKHFPIIIHDDICYFFNSLILEARAEILHTFSVLFWAMEFQEKMLLRFTDL